MKLQKQGIATLGLVLITILAAIQYIFLRNVPDTVSTFSFVFVTNMIGLLILGAVRFKKLFSIRKKTLRKGILLALELTGFNFFLLLGSRRMDAVITSSVVSLYFVFITPLLLLLRRKVNFFSGIATVIAVIALLLMFGADTDMLFSSVDVAYLIIADFFFAAYVISVSILGEEEDSTQLTLSQMLFAAAFALIGWLIESNLTGRALSLPSETSFWVSALFIGVCIRAIYGIVQISAQKYVSALKASLIFSTEIIITLLANPLLCQVLKMEYTPVTVFQVLGGVLLIIATLMVDDTVMVKMGYGDLKENIGINEKGEAVRSTSVARKMILNTLTFTMITLILSTVTFLSAIYLIRTDAVSSSQKLGETASSISSEAMMQKLEESIQNQVENKALLAEQKLSAYSDAALYAASYAEALYRDAGNYPSREVPLPAAENGGTWAMQRTLASPDTPYETLLAESQLLGNMEDVFVPIVRGHDNIATIYLCTESGLMVSYDPYSDSAVTLDYYEYRSSGWYKQARTAQTWFFTKPYQDGYGRGLTISCVAPFHDTSGNYAGCVAIDILMEELNASIVNDGIMEPSVAMLIDNEGKYIAGKGVDPLAENMGSIFDGEINPILSQSGREILERKNGIISVGEGEEANYIAFATLVSNDWIICIQTPVSSVIQPAVTIRESIDQNTNNVVFTVAKGIMNVIQSCLLLSAMILLFVTLFTGRYSKRISDPLKKLDADVRSISDGNLDKRTEVTTDDEIGHLANSFNMMTDSLQKYIADLKEVTAREQRISTELNIATQIQADMLPRIFPAFPKRKEFDLFAMMTPAKEVGGDFYDFFMIDNDHIGLVIADVSGKGVPAALFMVIAKTLIKNRALLGEMPAEILKNVNGQLCEGNEAELFVTVWMAILELSTGKGIAINAGHEHPVLRHADGEYELIKYRHGPAVAVDEDIRFRDHTFQLQPGDCLFVYTDGIPEAHDPDNNMFGTDRMLDTLNREPDATPKRQLENMRESVLAFEKDAPQFDDITMISFHYRGPGQPPKEADMEELTVDATMENLPQVMSLVTRQMENFEGTAQAKRQVKIAVEELYANIARHAYAPGTGPVTIRVETEEKPARIAITLIDSGIPYDPLQKPDPDLSLTTEDKPAGGMGVYMVKKSMDAMTYERREGENILRIVKALKTITL